MVAEVVGGVSRAGLDVIKGDAGLCAPLVRGMLFGFLIWGDLPNLPTLVGAPAIGGGRYLYNRESRDLPARDQP